MTTIDARLHFQFPFDRAHEYLREGFEKASTRLHEVQLVARVPATPLELSKKVLLQCDPDPGNEGQSWLVRWTPEPGGFYPSFDGKLSVEKEESDGSTILELTGTYTPPLGAAGAAFDHVLGRSITSDTAHEVLINFAAEMKARFALEQARRVFHQT